MFYFWSSNIFRRLVSLEMLIFITPSILIIIKSSNSRIRCIVKLNISFNDLNSLNDSNLVNYCSFSNNATCFQNSFQFKLFNLNGLFLQRFFKESFFKKLVVASFSNFIATCNPMGLKGLFICFNLPLSLSWDFDRSSCLETYTFCFKCFISSSFGQFFFGL